MPRTETSGAWLDATLTENLGVVTAPGELWDRVRLPPVTRHPTVSSPRWRLAMALGVAILLAVTSWSLYPSGSREFRSHDAVTMRAWLKAHSGLDIPLVAGGSPRVRLASVRFWDGAPNHIATAEVAFLVENRPATLRVSPAGPDLPGISRHRLLDGGPNHGSKAASWVVRGQIYTLACASPEDLRIACSLCHVAGAL